MIKRKDNGKFQVVVHLGFDSQGRRIQKTVTVNTKEEAKKVEARLKLEAEKIIAEAEAKRAAKKAKTIKKPDEMTVGDFVQQWYEATEENIRPNTRKYYKLLISYFKNTGIMGIPLTNITPPLVQKSVMQLPLHLKSSVRKSACELLRRIFNQAVEWDMLVKNPFRGVKLPKVEREEAKFWTEKEAATFLMSIKGNRYYVFFALALATGLRIGELMGLQWADVDFTKGCLNVNKTCEQINKGGVPQFGPTKTPSSMRTVYIDPNTVNLLKEHRKAQLEARLKAKEWHDFDLVFCNNNGGAKSYSRYREFMKNTCKRIGVTEIPPHGIRHTHATILLTHGVPMEVIADRLGHSRGNSAGGNERSFIGLF